MIVLEGRVATSAELEPARRTSVLKQGAVCAHVCEVSPRPGFGRCAGCTISVIASFILKEGGLSSEFVILETHEPSRCR